MKWKDEYATGIPQIDDQHRTLFRSTEDFRTALDQGEGERTYGLLLEFLESYCRAHFGAEERCMEAYRCPAAQVNKLAHANFIEVVRGFRQRFGTSGFRVVEARDLVDSIDRWLDQHICAVDVRLRESVREKNTRDGESAT